MSGNVWVITEEDWAVIIGTLISALGLIFGSVGQAAKTHTDALIPLKNSHKKLHMHLELEKFIV